MNKRFSYNPDLDTATGFVAYFRRPGSASILFGAVIVVLFVIGALYGQYAYRLNLYPHSPTEIQYDRFDSPPASSLLRAALDKREYREWDYVEPVEGHILGTDNDGRDIFIRVLNGASTYLYAGVLTVLISLVLGILLGSVSGYYRGRLTESLTSYITSVLDAYPRIVILIIIAFISHFNLYAIMITLGILNATRVARIVSGTIESLKNTDFILAAKEIGLSDRTIILKHIVWYNCRHLLSIQIIYGFASVILIEATLSYIGYGIGEPLVSWGRMIYEGSGGRYPFNFVDGIYWQAMPPVAAIIGTILGLNLLGDGLSKRFNVKQTDYLL
jgi:ABC-type dipeptide/oligopeptide/nickel transport system permease subunit